MFIFYLTLLVFHSTKQFYVNVVCYICKCVIVSLYIPFVRDLYIGRSPVDQCVHVVLNKYVLHQLQSYDMRNLKSNIILFLHI